MSLIDRILDRMYKITRFFLYVCCFAFVFGLLAWLLSLTDTRTGLALRFHVSTDSVSIEHKPTDCDFLTAPMGLKGCHYEKNILPLANWDGNGEMPGLVVSWTKVQD